MSDAPISARPHVFYIRPAPGWLELLFQEVSELAKSPLQKYKFEPKVTQLKGTVKLHRCDWRQGLEIMLRLTTAHDVEWLILESKCSKWSEVDAILERVPWDDILPSRDVTVHVTTDISDGFSTSSGKLRDNLCKIARVTHASEGAPFRFKTELRGEFLRVSVSLCGEPLYKRGYKAKMEATAPLSEHQAAACTRYVLAANKGAVVGSVFVPFAGTGTFGYEAMLVLANTGPGAFTRQFACDLFPCTPAPTMKFLRRKLAERLTTAKLPPVTFNDFNDDALAVLKENVAAFPNNAGMSIQAGDVFDLKPDFPMESKILVLLNPPYGDRLAEDSNIPALYSRLGNFMHTLAQKYPGQILGGCLCPDERTWKNFLKGLEVETPETHHFTHGGKEMRVVRWQA